MAVVWESTKCDAAGGANCFKTKHLFIAEKLDAETCRKRARIIWAARWQYKIAPPGTGISQADFNVLKKQVGGVKPPKNGLLCVTPAELQKLEALIIHRRGTGNIYEIPSGFIIMTSDDWDKCWEGYGGAIIISIEVIGDTYQVWHCDDMTTVNKSVPEW